MRLLLVHVLLVVLEQLILLGREGCWFECHLEAMCGIRWALDILEFGLVNLTDEVKCVLDTSFLPGVVSLVPSTRYFYALFRYWVKPRSLFHVSLA